MRRKRRSSFRNGVVDGEVQKMEMSNTTTRRRRLLSFTGGVFDKTFPGEFDLRTKKERLKTKRVMNEEEEKMVPPRGAGTHVKNTSLKRLAILAGFFL